MIPTAQRELELSILRGVDAHAHIYGGPEYGFAPNARFIPHPSQQGTARQFRAVLAAHGLTHALLVAAQPYGFDNSAMLDAIAASSGRFKGIVLANPGLSEADMLDLSARGIVGLRVNLFAYGLRELTEPGAERMFALARELGWILQVHYKGDGLIEALPALRATGMRLLVDHLGRPVPSAGLRQRGYQALLELGREGRAVVKLSGADRYSEAGLPWDDVDHYVAEAVRVFGLHNCVWGSDWPFVPGEERVDYGPVQACLSRWLPDEADRRTVLWETPSRLFGFS
ncbi:amidohydrolase family protein [Starkeya sp. ORNL1]|uniref:amidohydrolase family protein n=1 Tax=Starkeya sp. ORNL1 TaxID=2709380 RepID=UPI001464938B|nr:amidohydrolase family protein [Starkeya sp. ORNL1]QJP17359.1 amidohydrolase family protein [Starkeya sp. ORNL1]